MTKNSAGSEAILLDTHVWLWFVVGDTALPKEIVSLIENAIDELQVSVSVMSVWEIGMLERTGRIDLSMDIAQWMKCALDDVNIAHKPVTTPIALDSARLPGEFHGDPADRMIVATARAENMLLLTRDTKIIEYSKKKFVRTLAV